MDVAGQGAIYMSVLVLKILQERFEACRIALGAERKEKLVKLAEKH